MSRPPDETPDQDQAEAFLSRWSRRKEEARQAPPEPVAKKEPDAQQPAPELPPVDTLDFDSDYRAFFHPKVGEDVRRTALKKLFSDPRFNVMDGLDVYIDDYSKTEPIPPAMLAGLRQAQNIFAWAKEDEEARAREQARIARGEPRALEPPVEAVLAEPALPAADEEAAPVGIPEPPKPTQA